MKKRKDTLKYWVNAKGRFQWTLLAPNGRIRAASSEDFIRLRACIQNVVGIIQVFHPGTNISYQGMHNVLQSALVKQGKAYEPEGWGNLKIVFDPNPVGKKSPSKKTSSKGPK